MLVVKKMSRIAVAGRGGEDVVRIRENIQGGSHVRTSNVAGAH
jgi:hypothetical protein